MNENELKDHEYQCGSKTVKCEFCGENVVKTTYDLHLEYTCEKFNKDDKENTNDKKKDEDIINDVIDKKDKNKNEKNNKIGGKKRKRENKEEKEFEYKPKKKKYN